MLRAVIAHMELTDPDQLESLLLNKEAPVIEETPLTSPNVKYIPLTPERVTFLLSLMNRVHKPI